MAALAPFRVVFPPSLINAVHKLFFSCTVFTLVQSSFPSFPSLRRTRQVASKVLKGALHDACVTGEVPMKCHFIGERALAAGL